MYDFKPKGSVKDNTVPIMQVMGMNRKDRRAFSKVNNGLNIQGSNKPVVNKK